MNDRSRNRDTSAASPKEVVALMRLVHRIEAANQNRPSSDLDLRARMVIQDLGLSGSTPILDVRRRLQVTPSTMTSLIDRLEESGYVRRQPHPTDRRTIIIELTAKGQRAFAAEIEFYRQLIEYTLGPLGENAKRMVLRALGELSLGNESEPSPRSAVAKRGKNTKRNANE